MANGGIKNYSVKHFGGVKQSPPKSKEKSPKKVGKGWYKDPKTGKLIPAPKVKK